MRILLIDDDHSYRKVLKYHVEVEWPDAIIDDHDPKTAGELPPPLDLAVYDLILLAHPQAGHEGFSWLAGLKPWKRTPPVIVFAEPSDEFLAVDAMKAGAASFFPKARVTHQRLVDAMHDALTDSGTSGLVPALEGKDRELKGTSNYRFLRRLHVNDIASVYLAEADKEGRQLAFKVIRYVPDRGGEHLFDRFLQEYELIAALEHPNVVKIFDLGIADDHAFIAMEYLPAGSLAERINQALDPEQAIIYARQIASALDAIHATGVLHRDLKPANIMFREDGTLALIDFGLAKQMSLAAALTGVGQIFGTPYYMSPEQGHAEPTDQRSDLYSLGCIVYEMLTGQRPFNASTAMGVIYKHANAERPRLDDDLAPLQPLLDQLLAASPDGRPDTARAVIAALDATELAATTS